MSYLEPSIHRLQERVRSLMGQHTFLQAFKKAFPTGEIFLVGGAVRDILLNRETKDYDFLVSNVSATSLGTFLGRHGKVNWVGKVFGVYKLTTAQNATDEPYDIALPRTEHSFNSGGYRDFDVQTDPALPVEEDLKRRDYTVNAIAVQMASGQLVDPFNGLGDLAKKNLRAVSDPTRRFAEDASRMLRGIRLVCQLGFSFDPATWAALTAAIGLLTSCRDDGSFVVPRETISKELIKAMVSDPVRAFDLWGESGAFEAVIPELLNMKGCPQPMAYHSEGDVWTHTRLALSSLTTPPFKTEFPEDLDAETVLAVLFHDIGKPYTLQTPERDGTDRIRFNNHDRVGAALTRAIVSRLRLSIFPKDGRYGVSEESLAWLVEKHLLLVGGGIDNMRASTIEKHFLNPHLPGTKLQKLIFCDGMATVPPDGQTQTLHYWGLKKRLAAIQAINQSKAAAPAPLLSGEDVMRALNLTPGPLIGKHLAALREAQLSGEIGTPSDALCFLEKLRCH